MQQKLIMWLSILPVISFLLVAFMVNTKTANAVCYGCAITLYDRNCYEANDDGRGYPPSNEYRASSCPYPSTTTYSTSNTCSCGTTNYCESSSSTANDSKCGIVPTDTPVPATPTPTKRPTPTPEPPTPTPTNTPTPTPTPTSASSCPAGQNRVNCNNTWFTCCTGSTGYCTLGANGAANGVSCTAPPTATPRPAAAATSAPAATNTPVPPGGSCPAGTSRNTCVGESTGTCCACGATCSVAGSPPSCKECTGYAGGEYGGGEYGGGEYTVEPAQMTGRTLTQSGSPFYHYVDQICAVRCILSGGDLSCDSSDCVGDGSRYEATFLKDTPFNGGAGGPSYPPGTVREAGITVRGTGGYALVGVTPEPAGYSCGSSTEPCYMWSVFDPGGGAPWTTGRRVVHFILANPTPTLYPTIVIQGSLKEYLGGSCSANVSSSSISLNLNPVSSSGITVNCGVTPPAGSGTQSTYRCAVAFNNQTASPTPAQNFTLSASASSYSPAAGWFTGETNSCTTTSSNTVALDVAAPAPTTTFSRDIFFDSSSRWVKLKNASFAGTGSLSNNIPLNLSAYDSDDSAAQRYFIMTGTGNDPGAVAVDGTITLGTAQVSEHQWKAENNGMTSVWTRSSFYDYIKSRKSYTSISSLSDISANGIYYYSGLLPLNWTSVPSQLNTYKVVLIVPGQVDIDVANFNPTQSFALIADTINFNANVQSATGLFVAASVTTGDTSNQGLKITGNLIAQSSFNNQRDWTTNTKPSVFIVFDPSLYLNLLDTLSVATYDWRQLQ